MVLHHRAFCIAILLAPALTAQTVSGSASNGVTRQPLPGIQVRLLGASNDAPSAITDATGGFRIAAKPGDYYLFPVWAGYDVPDLRPYRVHVDEGQDPAPLEISLLPYPKLSGRVLDPERHPLAGIQVSVIPFRGLTVSPAVTDKEGRYEFKSLAPGEYAILAARSRRQRVLADGLSGCRGSRWRRTDRGEVGSGTRGVRHRVARRAVLQSERASAGRRRPDGGARGSHGPDG